LIGIVKAVLKYKVIKDQFQYDAYCQQLEALLALAINPMIQDEIDLLTLLIETYDEGHETFGGRDPILLLRSFMADHDLKAQDLTVILGVSKGYVSDILAYNKGLSREVIRN